MSDIENSGLDSSERPEDRPYCTKQSSQRKGVEGLCPRVGSQHETPAARHTDSLGDKHRQGEGLARVTAHRRRKRIDENFSLFRCHERAF